MAAAIDYYFATQSPWAFLGHERFVRIAREAGAKVSVRPVDFGRIFPASGGLPLGKRAPQRQAYRLVELRRFSDHLGVTMNVQPRFFPVNGDDASRLILAVAQADGDEAALRLAGAVSSALWQQERDIASAETLAQLLSENGLAAERLAQSREAAAQQRYDEYTAAALEAGVFGAPSYVVDGEIFWGQDRLDFLQRKLSEPKGD
ncbi:2-hydroxychromene-2-carboxylate isomerase [Ramlibacter humi]|uniref:2-hydroxychromene-2-carboxylate isomerase n=1 Tax=Ramlibacter humi TaxID=2530451 RepID=A0A4Z0BDS4_9BURK|nr:2-hydroxychromene-2-carboxylate isomerase [Ramlibacter humi]TFY96623.1 2-hydroxychromene-2-carboxylate isomerase [Ramlibacter humi]